MDEAVLYQRLENIFGNAILFDPIVHMNIILTLADAEGVEIDKIFHLGAFLCNGDKQIPFGLKTIHF